MVSRVSKGVYGFGGWGGLQATLQRIAAAPAVGSAAATVPLPAGDDAAATSPVATAAAPAAAAEAAAPASCVAGVSASVVVAPPAPGGARDGTFAAIQAAARAAAAAAAAQPGGDSTLAGLTERFVGIFLAAPSHTVQWDACLARLGATERSSRRRVACATAALSHRIAFALLTLTRICSAFCARPQAV